MSNRRVIEINAPFGPGNRWLDDALTKGWKLSHIETSGSGCVYFFEKAITPRITEVLKIGTPRALAGTRDTFWKRFKQWLRQAGY